MKVVILCGGQGTRLREETEFRPKPLVEIAGRPILWHIMKTYSMFGHKEFVLCLGYKGWLLKEYFLNYKAYNNDFTLQLGFDRAVEYHTLSTSRPHANGEDWRITFADTGLNTMTGGRIKQIARYITEDEFMVTYGDGVADININALLDFHRSHGKIGTVTAVGTPGRFGELGLGSDATVHCFAEKPTGGANISGGFFVFNRQFLDYLPDDPDCVLEKGPLEQLAFEGQLMAYRHTGFWQAMDTYREFVYLNDLWNRGQAPWKIWK
jgi:glucose-1-phosphate cytidylyltransferase